MKIEAGKYYTYYYSADAVGTDIKIERVKNGIAFATSGSFGDMGPFTMRFDAKTGEGLGDYAGSFLREIN